MSEPSNREDSGRDARGRFVAGNPGGGRTRKQHNALALWEAFLDECESGDNITRREKLLAHYYKLAFEDPTTARDAINRILGKVSDSIAVSIPTEYVIDWGFEDDRPQETDDAEAAQQAADDRAE